MTTELALLAVAAVEFGLIGWLVERLKVSDKRSHGYLDDRDAAFERHREDRLAAEQRHEAEILEWMLLSAKQNNEIGRLRSMVEGERRWLS